jgi:peroxiredoxin
MFRSSEPAALWIAVILLGLILISLWVFIYQLMKQQGRLLLRLDNVEEQLGYPRRGGNSRGAPANRVQPEVLELPIGTAVSHFRLPDITGKVVGLEEFRGRRVLLIHWSPQCGFCDLIAPDLAALEGDLQRSNIELLLLSYSEAEVNRRMAEEYGLKCPILLHEASNTVEVFQSRGTPAAYLLDEQGCVDASFASGSDEVLSLARSAASAKKRLPSKRPLRESRIERGGLKAGTPAPPFSLPDIYGRTVSLEEFRGRRVLLIFTDPHCGPCDQLGPQLVRLHREHSGGIAIVMIGRGDIEENRRKAVEYGFEFPVLIQDKWKLSKEYGIFATPVAFLIGEDGVTAANVATGVDAILALADGNEVISVRS